MKDYYKILAVKPDASAAVIKQSYRKLAMKYHPDRNAGDELSAAVFAELAEAYHVLNNSISRKKYNQQRFYTAASENTKPAESMEQLIAKAHHLKKYVLQANPFRLNKEALLFSIKQLLPPDVSLLLKTNEASQVFFFENIMWLSSALSSKQTNMLMQLLQPVFVKHSWLQQQFNDLVIKQSKQEQWEKYKVALAVLAALILCAVIFFTAGKK